MIRTVISLSKEEKRWLDEKAKADRLSMTEVVRRAIRHYQRVDEGQGPSAMERLLKQTSGTWKEGDGLDYQRRVRAEWEKS